MRNKLTDSQRASLQDTYKKIDDACSELHTRLKGLGIDPDAEEETWICGFGCGCSSFLGPHSTIASKCQRSFCKHSYGAHLT